jgi:HEPN domain-containing protein
MKTTLHEMGHIMLGHTAEGRLNDSEMTPRNIREVEAECVALIVSDALGLDGAAESRGYIQNWNGHEPVSERSAQRIFSAADKILKAGRGETLKH